MVIDGKQIAQKVLSQLKKEIEDKKLKLQMAAVLACPEGVEGLALKKFVELKEKAAEKIGINFKIFQFDKNISQPVMIHHNTKLSEEFDGVLVELPLPPHVNQQEILNAIPVEKDVDVLSTKAQELFYTNRSLIMPPSAEALGLLFENMNLNPEGKTVALFGYGLLIGKPIAHWLEQKGARISVIRSKTENPGDISRSADIIVSGGIKNVEKNLRSILNSFEVKAERTWNLKGIRLPVNFIVGSLEDETWKNLKDEIISSGVVLYGSYKEIPDNLKYCYVFYYSLRNLNRKDKMKFIRRIFGYSLKRGKKEYKQMGLLDEIRGFKLSSNAILISGDDILKVKNLFNEFRIKYRVKETWVRE